MTKQILFVLGVLLIIVASGCTNVNSPIACTADAKICPEGISVGRDPNNNCEFFPCREPQIIPTDFKVTPQIIPTDFKVTLEREGCFGTCPIYKITVNSIGIVEYDGERFVKVTGIQTARITQAKVKELFDMVNAINYFSLNDTYTENATFDAGSATSTVTLNGNTKSVRHAFEDSSAPASLTEFEEKMDEVTNSNQWIETAPDARPTTQAQCEAEGGEWRAHCGLIGDCCNFRTADAGESCTDVSQCEGACIAENEVATSGTCSEWKTTFGCYSYMRNGQAGGAICVD